MEKWCLHASLFIFDWIIIKVAGNQERHKSSVEFDFGPNQTTHFGVTCPWVTKISHFWTWISLKPIGQSWSNFMCSITGVGERLHKVLGQIDLGTLDSGERSLPFGLLVCLPCRLVQLSVQIQSALKILKMRIKNIVTCYSHLMQSVNTTMVLIYSCNSEHYLLSCAGYPLYNRSRRVTHYLGWKLSHVVRKPAFKYVNNKDTDQPVHLHSLISFFIVPCLDSIIHLISISEISGF